MARLVIDHRIAGEALEAVADRWEKIANLCADGSPGAPETDSPDDWNDGYEAALNAVSKAMDGEK
jgi:hypothetical protein